MAEIFLATQHGPRGFEKPVVLKRILAALYADPQFRDLLIDEARVSVGLSHSNIVQLLDLGSAGGRYFLVFELVDGWDVGRLIERARRAEVPVPPELALFILAETCRGLAYAHSKTLDGQPLNIVHRDISPQNVLVSEHGEVKIADFGIAKAMTNKDHTSSGVVKGKVAFMSPEQASGRPLDARSDLFSAGTMLYQLTTGKRPFDAATDLEVLYRVQKGAFEAPESVQPGMEPELAAVINKAMRPDPGERYQSAEEMLVAIERLLRTVFQPAGQTELKQWLQGLTALDGELPISRAPTSGDEPTTAKELRAGKTLVLDGSSNRTPRRRRDTLASAPTVSVHTGPGPTREDLQIVVPENAPPESRLQAESRRHGLVWAMVLLVLAGAGGVAFWRVARQGDRDPAPDTAAPTAPGAQGQTPSPRAAVAQPQEPPASDQDPAATHGPLEPEPAAPNGPPTEADRPPERPAAQAARAIEPPAAPPSAAVRFTRGAAVPDQQARAQTQAPAAAPPTFVAPPASPPPTPAGPGAPAAAAPPSPAAPPTPAVPPAPATPPSPAAPPAPAPAPASPPAPAPASPPAPAPASPPAPAPASPPAPAPAGPPAPAPAPSSAEPNPTPAPAGEPRG